MSKTQLINNLITTLETHTNSKGFRGLRFLHEINDFPSFYVHPKIERITHQGAGHKHCIVEIDIRGYCYSRSEAEVEAYARSIETAIQTYCDNAPESLQEIRTISLRTDEGLYEPYAIIDLEINMLYRKN